MPTRRSSSRVSSLPTSPPLVQVQEETEAPTTFEADAEVAAVLHMLHGSSEAAADEGNPMGEAPHHVAELANLKASKAQLEKDFSNLLKEIEVLTLAKEVEGATAAITQMALEEEQAKVLALETKRREALLTNMAEVREQEAAIRGLVVKIEKLEAAEESYEKKILGFEKRIAAQNIRYNTLKEQSERKVDEDAAQARLRASLQARKWLAWTESGQPPFAPHMISLSVPYEQRPLAKARGAKWCAKEKVWCAIAGADLRAMAEWLIPPLPDM